MKTNYLTFSDLFRLLKKHLCLLLAATVLFFAVGFGIRVALPQTYSATSAYYVRNMQGEEFIKINGLTTSQLASVQTLCKEYATLVETCDGLYERAASKLIGSHTAKALRGMVSATSDNTLLKVTVTHTDPAVVNNVAAALESVLADYINETAWPNLSETMKCVVLAQSAAPAVRSSLHPVSAGVLTGLVGLLLAYLFCLLRFLFGNTLWDEHEIARALPELPVLGVLRPSAASAEGAQPMPEGIRALRTNLGARLADTKCPLIGIVGAGACDVTEQLSVAFSGAEKRVLIMDLCASSAKQTAGLLDYLEGREASLDALLTPTSAEGVLHLFGGCAQAAAPQDLLATDRFRALLNSLAEVVDVVLLSFDDADTAAILTAEVTGYVLSVDAGVSGARQLRRACATLQDAEARVLGLAARILPKKAFS